MEPLEIIATWRGDHHSPLLDGFLEIAKQM
jgi:hypothetical protein